MAIQRSLLPEIRDHLYNREITIITGPRQVGKTTLMKQLKDELEKRGEKTLFLNLDYETDFFYFSSQEALINKIRLEIGKEGGYVFIDEIQRRQNAGLFLKGIYDLQLPYKLIVSGSGSLELKERIHESLVGRKRLFELLPVSFREYVDFNTSYKYSGNVEEFLGIETMKGKFLLEEYLNYGGYPRIVTTGNKEERLKEMHEIYQSYISRDIMNLLRVERPEAFTRLLNLLAVQSGYPLNFTELGTQSGLSYPTLKNYIWYAEKTFIIQVVLPFYKNSTKELTKAPVVYFYDPGLRNFSVGLFGNLRHPEQFGFLFQNLVFNILTEITRWTGFRINYYRTTDGTEVDFIINKGMDVIPVEVKFTSLKKPFIKRSLQSFINKYQPAEAWVINLSLNEEIKLNNTIVKVLPFYELWRQFQYS
ncbi:MAG: ATP-binding protein [Bacteroidetes bacterium]|nr:ATP-binding protein [Bacteroidota bacterium]